MADITATNKSGSSKTGPKVLRWIFASLVFLVLVLALFFQVSWKIDALLLIVLLTLTVVPRVFRKWIWFAGWSIFAVLFIWVFLPDNDEGWRPYTLDQEISAFYTKYAVPDELNAAVIYEKLPEVEDNYQSISYDFDPFDPNDATTTKPWRRQEYPEAAQWLDKYNDSLVILLQASRKKACSFQNLFNDWVWIAGHNNIRDWAQILIASGNLDLGEGRIDEGIEKHVAVLRMANHLHQQPMFADIFNGVIIDKNVQGSIKHFVMSIEVTENQLDLLDVALQMNRYNWEIDLPRILDYNKLSMKSFILSRTYQINSKGKTRFSRYPIDFLKSRVESDVSRSYKERKGEKAMSIIYWLFFPATPDKAGEIVDVSYERDYAMTEPEFDWELEPCKIPVNMNFNFRTLIALLHSIRDDNYYGYHDLYYRFAARKNANRLIIALVKYKNANGDWPETLNDPGMAAAKELLRDPINGKTFVYRTSGGDFILYSMGKNNIDESGQGGFKYYDFESGTRPDDILFWPPWLDDEEKDE